MKLRDVFKNVPGVEISGDGDLEILGLAYSSLEVRPGFLFAALRGGKTDGFRFVDDALGRGAAAVLAEKPLPQDRKAAWIKALDAREALALAAANFYDHPSMKLKIVGVTGTKGKTTVTYLLESILIKAGLVPGVIGTVNYRWPGRLAAAARTTPEAPDMQRMLAEMLAGGVTHCLIEVSSHGLDLKRVWGIHFDIAAFTNLSPEHLDYHESIEEYFEAKKKLFFLNAKKRTAVVNLDDPWGKRLINELPLKTVSFGLEPAAIIRAGNVRLTENGVKAEVDYPGGQIKVCSRLMGRHNLYNILAAIAAGLALNIPADTIKEGISALKGVPGRLEKIENNLGFQVYVDYAHTDEAMRSLLETVREFKPGRILLVFGAGGDRDKGKRPRMGKMAAALADVTFLTSDNPRSEDPLAIIADIEKGLIEGKAKDYSIVPDRREAIARALAAAGKGDCVLVVGKGHERTQSFKDESVPFDDSEIIREILKTMEAKP
ncbi:MAG: UDP-N-acetylmuramoyl-L-alanyl-D-glutamate--2,6-diaminopimelate ligase [Candidatus Aminicenantes bacterium RBG_16_63_16]|nr:MAG: UDP-N-acetylmuramoyl-L-alanyl-D-glutamate--2,6-diaminopimelate ligase [Candidatus Aminicenantes bacterium RBG_16_63_16]